MVPQHDILVAGFPCQPFSIAGVSKKNSMGRKHGFADETQGTLFFDVARIIDGVRPRAFVLENVRNLISHDKGRTFEVIRRVLADELGYALSWKVINAASWVPQRRQRIFIVGIRDGEAFDFDDIAVPEGQPVMESVLHRKGEAEDRTFAPGGVPLAKYTLSDGLWSFLRGYADKHREKGNGFGYGLVGPDDVARTMSARYGKDGSEILIKTASGNPRRLTPRECARLMGFDAPGQRPMIIPVSDAQAYKQFGNSVAVPCVAAVARAVSAHLERQNVVDLAA
jgi:DNA (cytosine-5)-methyltransferase 1